jgi:hypothetical protein
MVMILEIVGPLEKPQTDPDYDSLLDVEDSQGFSLMQVFMIPNTLFPEIFDHDNILAIGIRNGSNNIYIHPA